MEFNGTSKMQNKDTVVQPVLYCTVLYCTDHVYPAVEEPVLLDGDEALHLPAELVRGLAGHHPRSVKLRRRGPPVHLDILPGRQGRCYSSYIHIIKQMC